MYIPSFSTITPSVICNLLQAFAKTSYILISNQKMKGVAMASKLSSATSGGASRGVSILDFILRIVGIVGTLASAIAMGTTNETLSFFTQFIRFRARYNDLPALTFFVIANAVACAYLVLSLAISIFHIIRSSAQGTRVVLILLDTVMLGLLTAGASAATAIVYLAHKGNTRTNWIAICQQFNSFCERISGSLIGSYVGIVVLILLVLLSAVALSRQ